MLIHASRVLTWPRGNYITDGAVLVKDGVIAAVGTREELRAAHPDEPVLHHADSTLLPGLIDAHAHLASGGGPDPVAALGQSVETTLLEAMRGRAEQLLRSGVTTVRDLGDGGHLALRLGDEVAEGAVAGPRIISAGIPITPPGRPGSAPGGEVSGEDEIRALIRRNASAGAQVTQVMFTGGGGRQFTQAELTAVRLESLAARVRVVAHAHSRDSITAAVAADVDTIEFCSMAEDSIEIDEQLLDEIIHWDISVCPAISPTWPILPRVIGEERADAICAAVLQMAEAGVRLIAGSDAGGRWAGHEGFGLASTLEFYEYLGLSNDRIVEMATSEAAQALGVGDKTGRIAVGYSADLLVVRGNPLSDLSALREIREVFAAGTRCHSAMAQV
ncbi:amidohydrolase family protein [Streptomyces spectabilis]|uniref:amidohydrolase family protein n=1 Tax=Streptomyces spectabilis TaxID=68270 RepID=UPI0033E9ED27